MDILKNIISVICVSAVVYGVAMLLSPEGSMGKAFKNTVGIAVIATVVFSISSIKSISLEVDNFNFNNDLTSDYSNELRNIEVKSSCKAYIESILENSNINDAKTIVSTNISDDGSIIINEVIITCDEKYMNSVKQLLSDIGTKVTIIKRE